MRKQTSNPPVFSKARYAMSITAEILKLFNFDASGDEVWDRTAHESVRLAATGEDGGEGPSWGLRQLSQARKIAEGHEDILFYLSEIEGEALDAVLDEMGRASDSLEAEIRRGGMYVRHAENADWRFVGPVSDEEDAKQRVDAFFDALIDTDSGWDHF